MAKTAQSSLKPHKPSSLTLLATIFALIFATIFLGFGIYTILNPLDAVPQFFTLPIPTNATDKNTLKAILILYGAKDLFMAVSIYAAVWGGVGSRGVLGVVLVAASAVAFVDGWVCKVFAGDGEWGHWGYAPGLTVVGAYFLGFA